MATLICIGCETPVSPAEITCPGCGALVLGGANTRKVEAPAPLVQSAPSKSPPLRTPSQQEPPHSTAVERACTHCGTPSADPAALVCVVCLHEFAPTSPPTARHSQPDPLNRTRRDVHVSVIVLETTAGSVSIAPAPRVVIGRSPESPANRLLADFDNVSRRHAEIRVDHNGVWIADLGSTNGTYLDGKRLPADEPRPLTDGARLRLASNVETVIRLDPQEERGSHGH